MRKDIQGFEGLYQADSEGYIIKLSRPQKDKRYGEFTKEVILKPYFTKMKNGSKGYAVVTLHKQGVGKKVLVHRTVYEAFHGQLSQDLVVDHLNGDKHDNRLENLEAVSHRENTVRALAQGLMAKGMERSFSKMTEENFIVLLACLRKGLSQMSAEFIADAPRGLVRDILNQVKYKEMYDKVVKAVKEGEQVNTEIN